MALRLQTEGVKEVLTGLREWRHKLDTILWGDTSEWTSLDHDIQTGINELDALLDTLDQAIEDAEDE
mgnify:CR=1 FL=1